VATEARPNGKSATLLIVLIVVAVLYFARTVFIPLAFSILLSFMLAPLVVRLRHWGLGRIPSAALVVVIAFAILGVIGAVMASQLSDLAHKLPEYQHNVQQKLESIRNSGGGFVKRMSAGVEHFTDGFIPGANAGSTNQPPEERPVPVEIRHAPFSPVELIQKVLGSVVGVLLTTSIVIVFVIFMLIEQDDLRDRLIRLAGSRRVHLTTNVLNDAASRVSRYLLAQFVVNCGYGVLTGTVLYFLHIANPLLWGMLAALFRYIPYLGIWVAALMPAAIAFAVRPGWVDVPIVFGVYLGVDLLMYNFAEPLLYGSSTGLSPLAVLVAAVFWTWLWGPAGLLLATPLTVCAAVMGRHVPNLAFLQILLSDEPVLPPSTRFYQRMLALDADEAAQICEEFIKGKSLDELYDVVLVPALSLAETDRHRGKLDEEKEQFFFQNTRILIEDIAARADELTAGNHSLKIGKLQKAEAGAKASEEPAGPVDVLCIPARDEADDLGALMLRQLLEKRGISAKDVATGISAGEINLEVSRSNPKVACVAAVPPFAYMHTRYLCRRLRSQFKDLKLTTALLSENDKAETGQGSALPSVDETAFSLRQAVTQIVALSQVERVEPIPAEAASHPAP
jgi:predicted PurR-regulated permease PerM